MDLRDIIGRNPAPEAWQEGDKIPWHEPAFSARMLREHLTQQHDMASRRFSTIDRHVAWIHRELLAETPGKVLDLGCGPGLYTSRLARLGHSCVGIDFSPASIRYARESAGREGLDCRYSLEDLRTAEYGLGHDLVMMVFGEFNTFRPEDARTILDKAHEALRCGGALLLEPSTFETVHDEGTGGRSWDAVPSGLFSGEPHLYLTEASWDADRRVATTRYFIMGADGQVARHASSSQAYAASDIGNLLRERGFERARTYPSLVGEIDEGQAHLFALVAHKPDQ